MKFIPAFFLFLLPFYLSGQRPVSTSGGWSKEELRQANTAKDVPYLSEEEKNIIFYTNLVRMDGERFFNTYFQDFVGEYNSRMQQYSNYEELKVNTIRRSATYPSDDGRGSTSGPLPVLRSY